MVVVTAANAELITPPSATSRPYQFNYTVSTSEHLSPNMSIGFADLSHTGSESLETSVSGSIAQLSHAVLKSKNIGRQWRNVLGHEAAMIHEKLQNTWNHTTSGEGVFKFQTLHDEVNILDGSTIASIPQQLIDIQVCIDALALRINSEYANQLKTTLSHSANAFCELNLVVRKYFRKTESTNQPDELISALNHTTTSIKTLNTLFAVENLCQHVNYDNNWLKNGLTDAAVLEELSKLADIFDHSAAGRSVLKLKSTIEKFRKDRAGTEDIVSIGVLIQTAFKQETQINRISFEEATKALVDADTHHCSDFEKAKRLNQLNHNFTLIIRHFRYENARLTIQDSVIKSGYDVQKKACIATANKIREKNNTSPIKTPNLIDIDQLLVALANIANRVSTGTYDSPMDLWRIRALEQVISGRIKSTNDSYLENSDYQIIANLRGDTASSYQPHSHAGNTHGFGNLSLSDIPNNPQPTGAQLSQGKQHFLSGIILAGVSLINTLGRLKA